jgi:hypothetical protein
MRKKQRNLPYAPKVGASYQMGAKRKKTIRLSEVVEGIHRHMFVPCLQNV